MYRRPLPATNLRFLSKVMFDGRESSSQTGTQKIAYATNPAEKTFTWREGICRRDRKPMRFPDTCLHCI